MAKYANVIVDISLEKLDKTFQYKIPEHLQQVIRPGVRVKIPFGNRSMTGYVIELTDVVAFDEARLKEITAVEQESIAIESQLIALAGWMKKIMGRP